MARQELLIEYVKGIIAELEDVGKHAGYTPEQFAQIREILALKVDHGSTALLPKKSKKEAPKAEGIAKDDMSWEQYVNVILKSRPGGRGKTRDVVNYAVKANPKIESDLVLAAVRGKLSKLYRTGVIGATESANKSEGYEFHILSSNEKQ